MRALNCHGVKVKMQRKEHLSLGRVLHEQAEQLLRQDEDGNVQVGFDSSTKLQVIRPVMLSGNI